MRKVLFVGWLGMLGLSPAVSAEGMYAALSLGNASMSDITGEGKVASGLSYALTAGYEFNRYFAEEIGYVSLLGDAALGGYGTTSNARASSDGVEFAALGMWPVNDDVTVFARVGYTVQTFNGSVSWGSFTTKNLNGLLYGPGIRINLSKTIELRAGYTIYTLNGTGNWSANGNRWTGNGNVVLTDNHLTLDYHF